jgi:hypothetical protein
MANGVHGTEFKRRRGVRQGDPLSPLLLMAGSEGFLSLFALSRQPPKTPLLNQLIIELIDRERRQGKKLKIKMKMHI